MNRVRLFAVAPVAIIVLVVGGCGSASRPAAGGSTSTTVRPKLDLASTGRSSTVAAAVAGPAIYPQRPAKYVLDGSLPDLGASAPVWRMRAHDVTAADVTRFADAVGIAAPPVRNAGGWQVQGANATLSFLVADGVVIVSYSPGATGGSTGSGVAVATTNPGGTVANGPIKVVPPVPPPDPVPVTPMPTPTVVLPPPPVDVPNAADATTIARALLDRTGVLAGQTWATAVSDSGGVAISCPVGTPCAAPPPEVSARTVTFSLMLDGGKVDGVNWSVTIGEHRRVESVYGQWVVPQTIGSYPLRSTANVFADLQHGTAKYAGPQPMTAFATPAVEGVTVGAPSRGDGGIASRSEPAPASAPMTVHVIGVTLGVAVWTAYDHGNAVSDLVPTYRFRARVDGGEPYDIVVLALDPGSATFTEPAPRPAHKPLPPVLTPDTAVAPPAP